MLEPRGPHRLQKNYLLLDIMYRPIAFGCWDSVKAAGALLLAIDVRVLTSRVDSDGLVTLSFPVLSLRERMVQEVDEEVLGGITPEAGERYQPILSPEFVVRAT